MKIFAPAIFAFCKLPHIVGALSLFCNLDDFSRRLLVIVCGGREDIRTAASRYIKDRRWWIINKLLSQKPLFFHVLQEQNKPHAFSDRWPIFDEDERENSPTESFDGVGGWLRRRSPRGRQSRLPRSLTLFPAARAWFPSSRHRSGTRSALGHLTCHCLLQAVSGSHGGTCCRGGVRRQTAEDSHGGHIGREGGPLSLRRAPGHPLARGDAPVEKL